MGGDGVSDISAGAGEGVGGMENGAGLTSGSIAIGDGSSVGAHSVHNYIRGSLFIPRTP